MSEHAKRARVYDDPDWVYTPANSTDLRAKFDAIREQLKRDEPAKPSTVRPLRRSKP